jgi:hypothetical protein
MPASPTNQVQTTVPLLASGTFDSGPIITSRALSFTGSVFSDQSGTLLIEQSGDGNNWDLTTTINVTGGTAAAINVTTLDQYWRVLYTNGGTNQSVFRLYVNARDPYGTFLQAAGVPTPGGAYGVLLYQPGAQTYSFVGRFDGSDEYGAITSAAIATNQNGKYAAFVVANCVVSEETIIRETEHAPDSF